MKYVPVNDEEKAFLTKYQTRSYDRPSVTSDVVALRVGKRSTGNQTGNQAYSVLLIQRGGYPYLHCWALPGGFFQRGETMEECALRELQEETALKPEGLYPLGCFSAPDRDPRGWIISNAYLTLLPETASAQAGDDARAARWFQLSWTLENRMLTLDLNSENVRIRAALRLIPQPFDRFALEILPSETSEYSQLAFDHAAILATAILSPILQK